MHQDPGTLGEVLAGFRELSNKVDVFKQHLGLDNLQLNDDETLLGVMLEFRTDLKDFRKTTRRILQNQEKLSRRLADIEGNDNAMDVDEVHRPSTDDEERRPTKRLRM